MSNTREIKLNGDWVVELPANGPARIEIMPGWALELASDGTWEVVNWKDGKRQYYNIIAGPYSPVIQEDPANAYSVGPNEYIDGNGKHTSPAMKVKGVICKSSSGTKGEILYRGNLTNFFGKDGGSLDEGGKYVDVQGNRYQLYRLVADNKNRLIGYIGFYKPIADHDGGPVEILEVEDLG